MLALFVLTAGPLSAQADSLVSRLEAVSRIRVVTVTASGELERPTLAGDSLRFAKATLRLRSSGRAVDQRTPIAWHDVESLAVPGRSRVGRGALIGAGVGLGTGLLLGAAGGDYLTGGEVVAVGAIVGVLGAGVGALIGSSPRWETIYERAPAP